MFYAHFVLSKKGPLAKVWLAAHWERKLTKAHVFETNIEQTVEDILNPKVKLALRTSGHLLLGVVRIYSRKAKYLLQDCNDCNARIKIAFRPISINLPAESRVATRSMITLPLIGKEMVPRDYSMTEIDFDVDMADYSDNELTERFTMNIANEAAITLNETIIQPSQLGIIKRDDPLISDFDDANIDYFAMMDLVKPNVGNADDLDTSNFGFGRRNADCNRIEDEERRLPECSHCDCDEESQVNLAAQPIVCCRPLAFVDEADAIAPLLSDAAKALHQIPPNDGDMNGVPKHAGGNANQDPENPVSAVPDGSGSARARNLLERLPNSAIVKQPTNERMHAKRKRAPLVDARKVISSDGIRAQLYDTSDIVRALDMAPSTLKLMHIKENSSIEKLWRMPGYMGDEFEAPEFSQKLLALFSERALPMEEENLDDREDFFGSTIDDTVATLEPMNTFAHELDMYDDQLIVPDVDNQDVPLRTGKSKRDAHDLLNEEDLLNQEEEENDNIQDFSELLNYDIGRDRHKRARMSRLSDDESDEDPDAEPEDHSRRSRRTRVVFEQFSNLLVRRHAPRHSNPDGFQSVNFKELTRGHQTRKEVAQRFYSSLVLVKLQAVFVEQAEPYGDIWVKKGGRFDNFDV
ncbi:Double-strand-break repair protein rad21-like protein [Hypsibius exemplaris]|uniref:Double-strand-break repair protein rad21-like protein n=1 Tax=Hypsibius exemplaris TaxID=2072580 RepID=A0A1W0X0W6_HYPEX|nr:Double-strand-break repair protein rad21-like protein [Hypsibius exemplaris]